MELPGGVAVEVEGHEGGRVGRVVRGCVQRAVLEDRGDCDGDAREDDAAREFGVVLEQFVRGVRLG